MHIREQFDFHGKTLSIETGRLANQAHGAALVQLGDTCVLVTVVSASSMKEGQDFLPLTVEYMERTYSAGRIPGGYFKREGRPTENEILTCRLMDRPIRPLFPKTFKYETQIIAIVLSADKENDPGVAALNAASAALMFSNVPFQGPVAGLRVGRVDGNLVINPTYADRERADLDLMVAVGPEGLVMVEGSAKFVPESVVVEALLYAEKEGQKLIQIQREMAAKLNIVKRPIPEEKTDVELEKKVRELGWKPMCEALAHREKAVRRDAIKAVRATVMEGLGEAYADKAADVARFCEHMEGERLRSLILDEHKRIDGRGLADIRNISCEVGVLPRTHGSALFTRGETQVLVAVTLGTEDDEQRLDLLVGERFRSFMLHYNFPPFSVGEIKRVGSPSRRDIGHGHLAERGVAAVLPVKGENFSYTIRIVSEVLESNGSSSMATVCGSSMALMDAGVPTTAHVGGIAMGLIKDGEKFAVLTDILGDEDHLGDMDFKVVGTTEGITSLQMDIKCTGLNEAILTQALEQARQARVFIIGKLVDCIPTARDNYSPFAPRITTLRINPDRIRDLIGPGGKNIRNVQSVSGASVNVEDDGVVTVAAVDQEQADRAIAMIRDLTDEAEIGRTYLGQVVKTTDFGAFVRIMKGVEGLVHISELSDRRVKRVEDVVQEGDEVLVKVISIDKQGKVRLSRREAMEERAALEAEKNGGVAPDGEAGEPVEPPPAE
jgi:polyribonucleotide nucleotidyltransferase